MLLKLRKIPEEKNIFSFKWQELIFRTYGRVPTDRLAKVLETTEEKVVLEAIELGLGKVKYNPKWLKQGYLTLLYDTWKLLPYEQILELLDWDEQRLSSILKEEDFFGEKLGGFKPDVEKVVYNGTSRRKFTYKQYVEDMQLQDEPAFEFSYPTLFNQNFLTAKNETPYDIKSALKTVSRVYGNSCRETPILKIGENLSGETFILSGNQLYVHSQESVLRALQGYFGDKLQDGYYEPKVKDRIIFGYETGCGDLLDIDVERAFSDELLAGLFRAKINGIFLHAIFYQLTKFPFEPSYSIDYKKRLAILRNITERCARYGIKIWLYVNEPRSMPIELFQKRENIFGYTNGRVGSLCTSVNEVKEYLVNASEQIATEVPLLGGLISITMSENLTHCRSKGQQCCPRCKERKLTEIVAEINNLMAQGLKNAKTGARVVAWTWAWLKELGWTHEMKAECIALHDQDVVIMCTSEDELDLRENGVITDYSVAHLGPSEKTIDTFCRARAQEKKIFAKIQTNNSWECPSLPYLPVFNLQKENFDRMVEQGVDGLIYSWTLGGYPSVILQLLGRACFERKTYDELMTEYYGVSASVYQKAFELLSESFSKMPFCTMFFYVGPNSRAPALKFFKECQVGQSSMIGYVYDDVDYWFSGSDEGKFTKNFTEVLLSWEKATELLPNGEEKRMALVAGCALRSSLHYLLFARTKNKSILKAEAKNVEKLYFLAREDGRIGYETSNHYLFTCRSLIEKIIALKEEEKEYENESIE